MTAISSPCVRRCRLDEERKFCTGCGRTLFQIGSWSKMSEEDRLKVMAGLSRAIPESEGPLIVAA